MAATEAAAVLPVDKPAGPTSHDVVAIARRALGTRRVGHTGTLDPFATGLLLLCIGQATRVVEFLTGLPKTYEARLRLGTVTATDDATGTVVTASDAWRDRSAADIAAALHAQRGRILQRPPAFSAKKVAGERAYRRARQGEPVTLAPVEVEIFTLDILDVAPPDVDFRVTCSAGTYIRAIARDAGEWLHVGAHLTRLRRTAIGSFDVLAAVPLDRLDDAAAVAGACIAPLEALRHLPRIDLDPEQATAIRHGRPVPRPAGASSGPAVLAAEDALLAIADVDEGVLRPRKVFADA
jgi:tRNA pseudouridine55 synthase